MENITLRSVNWEHGMLLTPEHFLRQELYLESLPAWQMRYLTVGGGLVGGGVRLPESDLGALRHDPIVVLDERPEALAISVGICRGVSPSGLLIDVEEGATLAASFAREQLAGVAEAVVYVIRGNVAKTKLDGATDTFNPQMMTERAFHYRLALDVTAADKENALAVARIRRPAVGMHYEKDANYIPPCLSLSAYSALTTGWRSITELITNLAAAYAELYRAMREFMVLFTERGIETEVDRDSLNFAERMVMALQDTAYQVLDRTQSPERFFAGIRKLLHQTATFFDLAPGMQQYYEMLREVGETELIALVQMQKRILETGRTLRLDADLGVEVRSAMKLLAVLAKLERALEGKYIDFRRSPSLEGMNFIFDRQGKVLYKLAAKPARVQGVLDELTIFFSQLRIEGREKYRLILVGDRNQPYEKGTMIGAEIRLNEGSGFRREAIILHAEALLDDQYNIELDFEAPDVPIITDVRVTVQAFHAVRTALLFTRHRFYAGRALDTPNAGSMTQAPLGRADELAPAREAESLPREAGWNTMAAAQAAKENELFPFAVQAGRLGHMQEAEESLPPWSPRRRESEPTGLTGSDESFNRTRRRRLE